METTGRYLGQDWQDWRPMFDPAASPPPAPPGGHADVESPAAADRAGLKGWAGQSAGVRIARRVVIPRPASLP